jgi:hypothetical protein
MEIGYKFIPQGQKYRAQDLKREVVLGGCGINGGLFFDHQSSGGEEDCAAMLVLKNSARLNELFGEENVTIVTRCDPNFDSACAAWLVKSYLTNKRMPEGAAWLAEYAAYVVSGKLRLKREYFLTPVTAMYAFYETVKATQAGGEGRIKSMNARVLERAFPMLDWCAAYLTDLAVNEDEPIFIRMSIEHLFQPEYRCLKEDRPKYDKELDDSSICEKIEQFKLCRRDKKGIDEVRALIYRKPTESLFVKCWARCDGYMFILLPQACGRWENELWKPGGFSGLPNRVTATVPDDAAYTLKPLAEQLEREECAYERRLLGDAAELKRPRTVVRHGYENESWVTNNDPWDDGSANNNTAIASPSSCSLLTTEQIISTAKNHTKDDLSNARLNIICPVLVKRGQENGSEPWTSFGRAENEKAQNGKSAWVPVISLEGTVDDAAVGLEFDAGKLFDVDQIKSGGALWFLHNGEFYVEYTDHRQCKIKAAEERRADGAYFRITNSRLVCFSTGVGFALLSVELGSVALSDELSIILKGFHQQYSKNVELLLGHEQFDCTEPVFLVYGEFDGSKYVNLDIGRDVLAACAYLDESIACADGPYERTLMEQMLLRLNAGTVIGLSRNCTMLASVVSGHAGDNAAGGSALVSMLEKKLDGPWLYAWLPALHQQLILTGMIKKLGTAGRSDLYRMRSEYVRLTADAGVSLSESDPMSAELSRRRNELLELRALREAVNSQLVALDQKDATSFWRKFTWMALIFFPLSLALSVLQVFPAVDFSSLGIAGKILSFLLLLVCGLSVPAAYLTAGRKEKKPANGRKNNRKPSV